jgi:hypothetical protein
MASYYSDPNLQAALLAQAAYEADRQQEGGDQGGGFLDTLGKAALIAGAGTAAALGGRRLLANRAARGATKQVSVEDLGNIGRNAEDTVRRAASRAQTAPAPSQPPPSRPSPGGMIERLGTMEENARIARAERMPGVMQADLSGVSPERARATLGTPIDRLLNPTNPTAEEGIQGFFRQSPSYGQLPDVVQEVASEIKALPPARTTSTDFLSGQLGGRGYIEQTVLNRAAEQAAGDLIDEVSAFSNKGARSEIARQAASIQSQERKNLWNLVNDIQNETLVNQQQTTRAFNVDQAINALESGEDQMTGRTMSALQRNEDIDIGTVDRLQDTYEAPLRTQAEPTEALANRQDASVNAVADMMPDGRPLDQAEGIDLRTGQRFSLNTSRQTRTGLGPGQSVEMTSQPVSTTGFVKDFIAKQRGDIASQLEQEGGAATTGRVEKELASRLGSKSYEYGSEFTKTKQAMEVGLEDPRYLQATSLSAMPNTRMVGGTEFNVDVKDVMQDDPELAFRKPFISEQTAINSEQDFINKQNEVKNWLGGVRLEVTPRINTLAKQQQALGEQQNMLLYSLNQRPDRELGQQLRNVANQMQSNESELNFLNNRLAGATNVANEQLEELSKWTPSTLVDWSGEGTVVRPRRTAPDTMSFEAEGGELSNIERGSRMAQPGPNDLEIAPGGLLSGGRARSVSNIGQDIGFDPETGERVVVPLVDETGERIVQKLAGKRMGADVGVRGRGGVAGLDTNASIGIYGAELGPYGTAAQTKTGAYTQEASQVPSLVNSEPVPRRQSGGFFTYPQQREANPAKYAQTPTPQRQESVRLSEAVRKGQMQIPQMQGPIQSPGDPSKYFEYNLWDKFNKVTPQSPVQLSFSSDIVPPIAEARTTAADVAAQQLEAYMGKLQRGRSTPLSSEVVIQPKLLEDPGPAQMFLPLATGQQRTINTGVIKPAVLKPIRAQGQRQVGPLVFQPNLLS